MSEVITISAAACLTGTGLNEVRSAEVEVSAGFIRRAGARSEHSGVDIDLGSLTLVPGFIDSHVHIGFFPPIDVLKGGVTTARDLGWPPDDIYPLVALSADTAWPGPRIFAAGPMLTCPGGYPTRAAWAPRGTGRVVANPEEAREAVQERADEGATIVKIALNPAVGPVLDLPTLQTICDSAHERGLRVTGHIFGLDELHKALDAGIDELAHMLMSPERIPDETFARMAELDVCCVPTLSIHRGRQKRVAIENLARFLAAGGEVIYGTDLGNDGPRPGIDPREVGSMIDAGMDGRSILTAATVRSAARLGLPDVGVLEPGMQADIIGIAGDPLTDPRVLADVRFVMRAGNVAFASPRGP